MERSCAFVVPGSLDAKTGGTIYDRKLVAALRARGWTVDVCGLDALASLPDRTRVLVDGLAYRHEPDVVERAASRLAVIALVHLPLALEPGLDPAEAQRLRATERRVLEAVKHAVVTGEVTRGFLVDDYGVARDRITIIEPGTDRVGVAGGDGCASADVAQPVRPGAPVRVLCVAALTAGKGHDVLLRALATVRDRWTLTCAGSLTRQPDRAARARELVRQQQLDDRVQFVGELDDAELEREFERSDLFALATLRETYGMAVAEAIAHGLLVVSTTTGAIPKIVGDAGLLVAPGNQAALGAALQRAIGDASLRARLGANARRQRQTLPTWDAAAAKLSELLQAVDHERIAR